MSFRGGTDLQVKNAGAFVGRRGTLNLTGFTVADDAANKEVDISAIPAPVPPATTSGRVSGAGVIQAGTGFTVVRVSAGQYTVTFTTPFTVAPIVVTTAVINATIYTVITSLSVNAFTVLALNGGVGTDAEFNFFAEEPS